MLGNKTKKYLSFLNPCKFNQFRSVSFHKALKVGFLLGFCLSNLYFCFAFSKNYNSMKVNIFGATGLVGGLLLEQCLQNSKVTAVNIFVRSKINLQHPKLKQVIATADSLGDVANELNGDVTFNCLGTTLKKAGSKEAQYAIDCDYPVKAAQLSAKNGIPCMVNVSSVGASINGNFYLKTKAEMEAGVAAAIGQKAYFVRPSFITGDRKEFRLGEKIGIYMFMPINWFLLGGAKKYRSIDASIIAKAMLQVAFEQPNEPKILHFDELNAFAARG
jgi:uncharacterized protein YbjT (DUF2867 family)